MLSDLVNKHAYGKQNGFLYPEIRVPVRIRRGVLLVLDEHCSELVHVVETVVEEALEVVGFGVNVLWIAFERTEGNDRIDRCILRKVKCFVELILSADVLDWVVSPQFGVLLCEVSYWHDVVLQQLFHVRLQLLSEVPHARAVVYELDRLV